QQREQQYSGNDIRGGKSSLIHETKRAIKPVLACQPGGRRERHDDAGDGNAKHLDYMAFFVMTNFMREYGFQLRLGELRDQCVKQDDFSKTSKAGEEGVGVARALTAVHHFNTAHRKMGTVRQCKEALAQLSFGHWRELVEKRHDDRRRDEQQKQLEG